MPILFDPVSGQGVQIHEMQVNSFLQQGYRTTAPDEPKPALQPTAPTELSTELVKINSVSLKDLTEKLGLTTQQSKELRDGRPYASAEDLIAKIPTVQWTAFTNLSYEV